MQDKIQMLHELNLNKNVCFNQISQTDKQIHITKSKTKVETTIEIKEIFTIQTILEKYRKNFNITISTDEVIIQFK